MVAVNIESQLKMFLDKFSSTEELLRSQRILSDVGNVRDSTAINKEN